MTYVSEVAADTPIGRWPLDETSGSTAEDTIGSADGTWSGTFTVNQSPLVTGAGKSAKVNGAGGLSIPLNLSAQNKITVEFWVIWTHPTPTMTDQILIEFTGDGMGAGGFAINNKATPGTSVPWPLTNRRWRAEMGTTHFAEFGGDPSDYNPPRFAYPATPTKKYHVVLELDRTAVASTAQQLGSIKLWVNGVPRLKTVWSGASALGGNFANGTLYLGGRTASSQFAVATYDELAVYSGLLSQARIDAHYLAGSGLDWIHPGTHIMDYDELFPSGNIWQDILPDDAPYHASSVMWREQLIGQLGLRTTTDGGSGPKRIPRVGAAGDPGYRSLSYWAGTTALYVVPDNQPLVPVALGPVLENWPAWDRPLDFHITCMDGVPVPDHAVQELSADGNVTIWQPGTGKYWEFWNMYHNPGNEGVVNPGCSGRDFEWFCYSGGHFSDTSLSMGMFQDRYDGVAGDVDPVGITGRHFEYALDGQTATRVPMAAAAFTVDEWNAGVIEHALHLEVGDAWATFLYPAHSGDGTRDSTWIPEGAFLRIPHDVDIPALYPGTDFNSRKCKMLALACQKYGMIITDKTALGCAIRMRGVLSYSAEGGGAGVADPGSHAWNLEVDAQGFLKEYDIMMNFPWGVVEVLDPDWVEDRWPATSGIPPAPRLIEQLIDNFSTGLSVTRWPTQSVDVAVVSEQATIPCTPAYSAFKTIPGAYQLSSSSIYAEIINVPDMILGTNAGFTIVSSVSTNCYVEVYTEGTDLMFEWRDGDSPTYTRNRTSVPYSATSHRWWRIRKTGDNVFWDTSPDGLDWSQQFTVDWATTQWPLNAMDTVLVSFFSGNWQGQTLAPPDNLFVIDNVNTGATTSPPTDSPLESKYVKLQVMIMDPANDTYEISYIDADALFEDLTPKDPLP